MITFKEFLNESHLKNLITTDELTSTIKDYSDAVGAYRKGNIIYKGFSEEIPLMVFSPQHGVRKSAYTSNIYTMLIDNSDEWKSFPKRSKSIICSTNKKDASGFGDVYIVLPKNNTKIAVAPERDLWFSFPKLEEMGMDLESLNKTLLTLIPNLKDDSYESVVNGFRTFDKAISNTNIKDYIKTLKGTPKRFLEAIAEEGYKGSNFLEYILDILYPKDFEITDIFNIHGRHEVWFSNDCLVIEESVLNKYL